MAGTADDQSYRLVARIALRVGIRLILSGEALIGQVSHRASLPDFAGRATLACLFRLTPGLRYPAHVPTRLPADCSVVAVDSCCDRAAGAEARARTCGSATGTACAGTKEACSCRGGEARWPETDQQVR